MSDLPTAEELIDGLKWYVDQAHALGLSVYIGTLLPIEDWRTYAPFREELKNQVNEWICKPEKSFWIVLMDVDEFKAVNDTYGHGYGDDVLREAGRLMLEEMMGKGIAARFGGEEFMLVFEQDDRDQVLNSFRNIQEGLRRYSQNTRQTDITISGGMERYEADKQLDLLFTYVDRKLYIAKNNGKNRIVE